MAPPPRGVLRILAVDAVIVLSSLVGASSVGLNISAPALHAKGREAILAPTVTFGRHPGWGPPGGAAVSDEVFAAQLEGLAAHPMVARVRWVISGYFASPAQIAAAARLVDGLRAQADPAGRSLRYACDPVMGDAPKGLYVPEAVAEALAGALIPRADVVTPNVWEAQRLTGAPIATTAEAAAAAGAVAAQTRGGAQSLCAVTSAPVDDALLSEHASCPRIGAVLSVGGRSWLAATAQRVAPDAPPSTPRPHAVGGTGDLFAALLVSELDQDAAPEQALAAAVGGVDAALAAAFDPDGETGAPSWELPRAGLAAVLAHAPPAPVIALDAAPVRKDVHV